MITIDDLSKSNIVSKGGRDFELEVIPSSGVSQSQYGYKIASSNGFGLYYAVLSGTVDLNSGATISGNGFLITETVPSESYLIGLAFYPWSGPFDTATDEYKQEVVDSYNSTIEGDVVETDEDVLNQYRNEDGETNQEIAQREREEAEAEAAAEYERTGGAVNYSEPIREDNVIREFDERMEFLGGAESVSLVLIEKRRGTTLSPIVTYQVERHIDHINHQVMWSETFQTQEEAEIYFDDFISSVAAENVEKTAIETQRRIDTATKTKSYEDVDVFFKETDLTFESMLVGAENFEYTETAFRKARTAEVGGARKSGLYAGPYGDAATFSNNGNTLNLDDFDTPRVTTEGVTENPSGAVAFTIKQGWKVSFTLEVDDWATFIAAGADETEAVTSDGNSFDFTMYGGDRIEIDIDNEKAGIYPFLVTSQGRKWSSAEEVDDEVSLTMVKAEQLYFKSVSGERVTYVQSGEIKSETVNAEIEGPVSFSSGPLSESANLMINSRVNAEVNQTPEYLESMTYTRDLVITDVAAEGSFVDDDEIIEDITEPIKDAVGGVWDSIKWWLLGGVVVVVAVVLIGVYVNGKSRSSNVVQPAPISEA